MCDMRKFAMDEGINPREKRETYQSTPKEDAYSSFV